MRRKRVFFAFCAALAGVGCSLVVSYDGYGDGVRTDGGDGIDGSGGDAIGGGDGPTGGDGSSSDGSDDGTGSDAADGDVDVLDAGSDATRRHALVVLGGSIFDGAASNQVTNVEYAIINADGTLGAFVDGTPLPFAQNLVGATAWGSSIFVDDSAGAYAAVMLPDGGMSSWATIPSIPRSEARLAVFEGQLYLVTGEDSNDVELSDVWRATITGPQSISGWTQVTPLPADGGARGDSTLLVDPVERRIYILGGDKNNKDIGTTLSAPIQDGGALGAWTDNTPLPSLGDKLRAVLLDRRITVIGASFDSISDRSVHTTLVQDGGVLGSWQLGTEHPVRDDPGYALHGQFVYLVGGETSAVNLATVVYAPLVPATGFPGAWMNTSSMKTARHEPTVVVVELP